MMIGDIPFNGYFTPYNLGLPTNSILTGLSKALIGFTIITR